MSRSVWSAAYPAALVAATRKAHALQIHPQRPKRRDTPHSKRFALFRSGLAARCCIADFQSAFLRIFLREVEMSLSLMIYVQLQGLQFVQGRLELRNESGEFLARFDLRIPGQIACLEQLLDLRQ